jgi:hypothetical protein
VKISSHKTFFKNSDRAANLDRAAAQGYSYPGTVQKRRALNGMGQVEDQREDARQPLNRAQGYSYPQRRNAFQSKQGKQVLTQFCAQIDF